MKTHQIRFPDGRVAVLYTSDDEGWLCPVCGAAGLHGPAYDDEGAPSFQMCKSCEFEYGFDDEPGAPHRAIEGVQENWDLWRSRFLNGKRSLRSAFPDEWASVTRNLRAIGIEVE